MALISRLPIGGGEKVDDTFNKDKMISFISTTKSTPSLVIDKPHTNTSTSVFLGTINSSIDWIICSAKITAVSQNVRFKTGETWYELRDKHNNIICMFNANDNNISGGGGATSQRTLLRLTKGENYLYFCSHDTDETYGATYLEIYCQDKGNSYPYLSSTGAEGVLTWTSAE